jgi:hypothetical protein
MSAPAQSLAALSQTATTGIPDILSGTEDSQAAPAEVGQAEKVEKGFFELLVQSIWEVCLLPPSLRSRDKWYQYTTMEPAVGAVA